MLAALAEILWNNGTTGGTDMDGLLGSSLGIKRDQFTSARVTKIENQGI